MTADETAPPQVDAHQHFWRLARGDYRWLTPELAPLYRDFGPADLRPELDACGVSRTIVVQAAPTEAETAYLLDLADEEGFVAGVVGWSNFAAADAPERIERLAARPKLKGLRPMIQDLPDADWMLRRDLTPTFETLARLDLAFDALVRPPHLPRLLSLLERHPALRCVIDHGGKPEIREGGFDAWAPWIARLARETSAFCKLSGLATEDGPDWSVEWLRPYVEHLLASFGPERLIWGSDWPVLTLAGSYGAWHEAAQELLQSLDGAQRNSVFGGNAAAFYHLAG